MIIVSDTSCISNLFQIDALHLLQKLFGKIIIPNAVFQELIVFHKISFKEQLDNHSVEIVQVIDAALLEKVKKFDLDTGETEAIALALQFKNVALIIDEIAGKRTAEQLGIKTVGLLGVILLAKEQNIIAAAKPLFDNLKSKTTFHFSASLYNKLLQLANEQ